MPVYEYKCEKCNEQFEVMQKVNDKPLISCSSCGGELRKLITYTSFVLKGSGWYVTDYPSEERKKAMEAENPASKDKDSRTDKESKTKEDAGTGDVEKEKKSDSQKETVNV